jgi:hypothetical protein
LALWGRSSDSSTIAKSLCHLLFRLGFLADHNRCRPKNSRSAQALTFSPSQNK